jgi:catechol 2,3-dioxygenase-like lactoylglutathione lyase family enzyme
MTLTRRDIAAATIAATLTPTATLTPAAAQAEQAPKLDAVEAALRAIRNLDYVIVFARDMAAMRTFYAEILGLPVYRDVHPSWIEYRIGGSLLVLTERGFVFNDEPTPAGALSVQLAFRVTPKEVDACADALRARGIKLVGEPTDQPWGHRTLFFRDPDGNVLEIYADL